MMSDLNMIQENFFVLLPLFGFTVVIKLINFDFESDSNNLILFDKKKIWRQI